MFPKETVQALAKKFPGTEESPLPEKFVRDPEPSLRIPPEKLHDICQFLREDPDYVFDLPIQMTAVDYIKEGQFEIVYMLYSTAKKTGIVLKSRVPRDRAVVSSVTDIWPGMNFQEREVYDLMGIEFKGHPYLKRIMMWEGFPGYPLRKDYVHTTDKYDSGLEVGTPGLDEKGIPIQAKPS